jgi:hypothetical protein
MHSPDFEVLSLFLVSPATVNDFGDFCRVNDGRNSQPTPTNEIDLFTNQM